MKEEVNEKIILRWLKDLEQYGLSKKNYIEKSKILLQKSKKFTERDVIWSLLNEAILKNINVQNILSSIYYTMGRFVAEEGLHDPNQFFKLSTLSLLKWYKEKGHHKVRYISTLSSRTCSMCNYTNGRVYDIDEAIKDLPVPNSKCHNKIEEANYTQCRCALIAI